MVFPEFVNPFLAWGVALAVVPLIIHLLNRRRHRPLPWAAMRFVLAAYRKTRRRAQLENLLLLLLRMAAIALLALALARPFTRGASPLAALTESRRDVVLVLDGSASTGYRANVRSVHEAIVERAREVLLDLDRERGDRVRLVHAASTPRLLLRRNPEEALSVLQTLTEPTDEPFDLGATLAAVREYATEEALGGEQSSLEVRLFTDLQRRSFFPRTNPAAVLEPGPDPVDPADPADPADPMDSGERDGRTAIVRELDALHDLGVTVIVEDLGPVDPVPPNLSVSAVRPLAPILGPGSQVEIGVEVLNQGSNLQAGVRVSLTVDGDARPGTQLIEIPARGRAQAVFPWVPQRSGYHAIEARLDGDRLAVDDQHTAILHVPPTLRVLLVNGEPAPEIDQDEVGLLAAVLDPVDDGAGGLSRFTPFQTTVVTPDALGSSEVDLSTQDVIWLANVRHVSRGMRDLLEARVAAGAGLVISAGANVDPKSYNSILWSPDGSGLVPAELQRRVEAASRGDYYRAKSFDGEHPSLSFFQDDRWQPLLTELPVYGFLASTPDEGSRVPCPTTSIADWVASASAGDSCCTSSAPPGRSGRLERTGWGELTRPS